MSTDMLIDCLKRNGQTGMSRKSGRRFSDLDMRQR
jgi:hypothetical protein